MIHHHYCAFHLDGRYLSFRLTKRRKRGNDKSNGTM